MTSRTTGTTHVTLAGGKVFVDLGFDTTEAAALKEASDRIVAEKLTFKETLLGDPDGSPVRVSTLDGAVPAKVAEPLPDK